VRAPLGVFLCLVVALVCGCENRCVRNSDCPPGYLCQASGLCDVAPFAPPGQADAGSADSGASEEGEASAEGVDGPDGTDGVEGARAPAPPAGEDRAVPEDAASGW
jgi:hypothetical protein